MRGERSNGLYSISIDCCHTSNGRTKIWEKVACLFTRFKAWLGMVVVFGCEQSQMEMEFK